MSDLKWEKIADLWIAYTDIIDTAYTIEHDMDTRKDGWRSTFTTDCEWQLHDTLKAAKEVCQRDYDARIHEIASANGYVRVQDDERVVKVGDLTDAVACMRTFGNVGTFTPEARPLFDALVFRLTAAIDAAGKEGE